MPSTGQKARASGIYECTSCGTPKTLKKGGKIPPCQCGGSKWKAVQTTTKSSRKKTKKKKSKGFFASLFS